MSTGFSGWYGAIEYALKVGYPAPSVVFNHTIGAVSSKRRAELLTPIWYASAPPLPFTFIISLFGKNVVLLTLGLLKIFEGVLLNYGFI